MKTILVVTGTKREASTLRQPGVKVLPIGGSSEALGAALAELGASLAAIMSFGMGGALDPELGLGDWVIGTRVCGGAAGMCDPHWSADLARQLPQARQGSCYADGRLIGESSEKQRLFREHGALVADMESHLVATAAARLGIPFAILRCISDEASADLPPAIAVAMRPDGRLALGAIFMSILKDPAQLAELMRSGPQFKRAFASLERAGELAFNQN